MDISDELLKHFGECPSSNLYRIFTSLVKLSPQNLWQKGWKDVPNQRSRLEYSSPLFDPSLLKQGESEYLLLSGWQVSLTIDRTWYQHGEGPAMVMFKVVLRGEQGENWASLTQHAQSVVDAKGLFAKDALWQPINPEEHFKESVQEFDSIAPRLDFSPKKGYQQMFALMLMLGTFKLRYSIKEDENES